MELEEEIWHLMDKSERIWMFRGCFADRNWLNSTQSCSQKHP